MKKSFTLLLLPVIIAGIVTSCKKDKGNPPVLPPEASMMIDFSNFKSGQKSSDIFLPKGTEDENWSFVAARAYEWTYITDDILDVPFTSYPFASDQSPSYLDDKTWQWSFSFSVLSVTYKARLTGQIRASDVLWNMYVVREGTGGFSEFVWFTGTSKPDGTGGQWTFNYSYQEKNPVLQIDWTGTGGVVETVKYTYVRTSDNFKNSYINYGKQTGLYNAYYTIHYYNGASFSDAEVEWSTSGLNGRVSCLAYFSDSDWHCWDGNYINVTCP